MNKNDIIQYILSSKGNINSNVLLSMLYSMDKDIETKTLTVTKNGTYECDCDGFSKVIVNVKPVEVSKKTEVK